MAAGNLNGDMYVWDLDAFAKNSKSKPLVLTHGKRTAQCRQCNFSSDGSILVGVFDDSTVWRYDLNPRYKGFNYKNNLLRHLFFKIIRNQQSMERQTDTQTAKTVIIIPKKRLSNPEQAQMDLSKVVLRIKGYIQRQLMPKTTILWTLPEKTCAPRLSRKANRRKKSKKKSPWRLVQLWILPECQNLSRQQLLKIPLLSSQRKRSRWTLTLIKTQMDELPPII